MEFVGFIAEQNKRSGFLAGSVVAACTVNPFTSKKEVFTFLFNSIHYFFFHFPEISNPISFYIIRPLFHFVGFVIAKVWNL